MAFDITKLNEDELSALAKNFRAEFDTEEKNRLPQETEWMQSLRQVKAKYDPEVKAKFGVGEERVHPHYTRSKVMPLLAKLRNRIPANEKNWETQPTPLPKISQEQLSQIMQSLTKQDESGNIIEPDRKQIQEVVNRFAEEKSANMSVLIDDQLTEDGYIHKVEEAERSAVYYGTGILKGAMTEISTIKELLQNEISGEWEQKEIEKHRPSCDTIPIWGWFPDTTSATIDKINYVYELHSYTKHEMRKLTKRPDFRGDVIGEVLKSNPKGDYKIRQWGLNLKTEGNSNQPAVTSENYEVLERNGFIDGYDLWKAGAINEEDMSIEYFCNCWIFGGRIIKLMVWPDYVTSPSNLYHLFYYDKDETSIFGTGLPKILRDTHLGVAACTVNALKNAAWVAEPCGEINIATLLPEQAAQAQDMHPGKWLIRHAKGQDANTTALNPYNITSRTSEMLALKAMFEAQGDMESSLPSYLFGMPERNADVTTKGAATRLNSLIDFVKGLIGNFDKANISFIESVYNWNMKFNPDESIKGDMQIRAIGSANIIIKEAVLESMAFMWQSLPPEAKAQVNWNEWMKDMFKLALPGSNKYVKSQEQVDAEQQQVQAKQDEIDTLNTELAKVKGQYDLAKAANMEAKAEKTRAEIPHKTAALALDNERKRVDTAQGEFKNVKTLQEIGLAEMEGEASGQRPLLEEAGTPPAV